MKVVLCKNSISLLFTRELMYLLVTNGYPYLKKEAYKEEHKSWFFDTNNKPFQKYRNVIFSKHNSMCLKDNVEYFFWDYDVEGGLETYHSSLVKRRTHRLFVDAVDNYKKYIGKELKDIKTITIPDGVDFYITSQDYPSDEYIVEVSRRWDYDGKIF